MTDKPPWREIPQIGSTGLPRLDQLYRDAGEEIRSIDDDIETMVETLQAAGELDNTVIVVTSDNGAFWGEHRLERKKFHPFEEAIHAPLSIRGPGFAVGTEARPTANIDLAKTIAGLAGATPIRTLDGIDLRTLQANPTILSDRPILIQTGPLWGRRYYHGVRVGGWKYIEHTTGEKELYDIVNDPFELMNVAGAPAHAVLQAELRSLLYRLRGCAGSVCTTPPAATGLLPPVANAGGDSSITSNSYFGLLGERSFDPDGGPITYYWTRVSAAGSGVLNNTGVKGIAIAPTGPIDVTYRLTVTDSTGLQSSDTVTFHILGEQAPKVWAGRDFVIAGGAQGALDGTEALDPEGKAITRAWSQLSGPPVTLSSTSAVSPTFTAPPTSGDLVFRLTVTDVAGLSTSDTVKITVHQVPIANAGPDKSVLQGAYFFVNATGSSDPDGGALSYQWSQIGGPPNGVGPTLASNAYALSPSTATTLTYRLTVTDPLGAKATDDVVVTVLPQQAPIANAGPDAGAVRGSVTTLTGAASTDPEKKPLSYAWTQSSGPTVSLSNAAAAQPTFTAPDVSTTLGFTLTVTDSAGLTSTDTVTITVHQAPVANAGPNRNWTAGALMYLVGTGSSDPDGGALTYKWTQVGGPAVAVGPSTASIAMGYAPAGGTTLTYRLTVTDPLGATTFDDVVLTIV